MRRGLYRARRGLWRHRARKRGPVRDSSKSSMPGLPTGAPANGKAAAAEFQKFIDHYGLLTNFPWGALARLPAGIPRA